MTATALTVAAAVAGVPAVASGDARAWQPEPARYGDTVVANVHVPMSDGVDLVGDVIYPTDPETGNRVPGRFPVLLTQNPYVCQAPASASSGAYYVDRGYIFASVCVRGTGRSGGEFGFMGKRDQQDGVELVDWAAHTLPGSNGIVGLYGCSYLGLTQIFTAGALRPRSPVKAMAPSCAGSDMYRESATSGGMPTESTEYMFPGVYALIGPGAGLFGTRFVASGAMGGDEVYDGTFWRERTPGDYAAQIVRNGIPVLLWSGWNDIFTRTSEEMYSYLQNAAARRPVYGPMAANQKASPRYQIVVGPWGHGVGIDQTLQLEWFDTWLKGENTPMRRTHTPMHLYQLGTNTWINTGDFPMVARYTRYYLGGSGSLTSRPASAKGSDSLAFVQPSVPGGSLTYMTSPFRHGATLAGPISASIQAASSGKNLNIIAALADVAPDGTVTPLTQGSLVASLGRLDPARTWYDANGVDIRPYGLFVADEYLTPGKPVRLQIVISPRVEAIAPGHSLRLTLTTQMDPTKCSALLGVHPCFPTAPQLESLPGQYQILRGPDQQSTLNLPLLPYGYFPPTGGRGAEPTHL